MSIFYETPIVEVLKMNDYITTLQHNFIYMYDINIGCVNHIQINICIGGQMFRSRNLSIELRKRRSVDFP
jgi:dethiobiotin synthetase